MYHNRREIKVISGLSREELLVDFLNITSLRIYPHSGEDGTWNVSVKMYSDLEVIEVLNRAEAKAISQRYIDFCESENIKDKAAD